MTIIFVIEEYGETPLAYFRTRELAEDALELRVRRRAADGDFGREHLKPELSWRDGQLDIGRWRPVAEKIREVELDPDVPWE